MVFSACSWAVFGANMLIGSAPLVYLYLHNRRMRSRPAQGTLTTRYQYHDNVVVLRIFLPLILLGVFGVGLFGVSVMWRVFVLILNARPLGTDSLALINVGFQRDPFFFIQSTASVLGNAVVDSYFGITVLSAMTTPSGQSATDLV